MSIQNVLRKLLYIFYSLLHSKDEKALHGVKGPFAYENWKIFKRGRIPEGFEYPLYTDAWIIGELSEGFGPYKIINTVPNLNQKRYRPSLILRTAEYINRELPDLSQTDDQRYHGGLLNDEIASLLSLSLGVRMKSGDATRLFDSSGDPQGRPVEGWGNSDIPLLPITSSKPVLPRSRGEHNLDRAKIISTLPNLAPEQATALVRAARLYQEAIWISDNTPELSWIMFVSAIETIAGEWRKDKESPVERLRVSRPELEIILMEYGGDELVEQVSNQIAPYMGATKTFIDFVLEYLPPPPEKRPAEAFCHTWEMKPMKKTLQKIYGYRSRALHGGKPFPAPMCQAPSIMSDGIYTEIPTGLATSTLGAVWVAQDIPMILHTFEYIVRSVLLAWWKSL